VIVSKSVIDRVRSRRSDIKVQIGDSFIVTLCSVLLTLFSRIHVRVNNSRPNCCFYCCHSDSLSHRQGVQPPRASSQLFVDFVLEDSCLTPPPQLFVGGGLIQAGKL